ncbi:MAG: hypothetical protein D6748_02315 [Calditrichaeota bacterium]|nr:MAG: hypothetical protein D6748_02315 [Calditrichota bacterium]
MSDKKFVGFLENPHSFIQPESTRLKTGTVIIKKDNPHAVKHIQQFIPTSFIDHPVKVTVVEGEDSKLQLTFQCSCGQQTVVELQQEAEEE